MQGCKARGDPRLCSTQRVSKILRFAPYLYNLQVSIYLFRYAIKSVRTNKPITSQEERRKQEPKLRQTITSDTARDVNRKTDLLYRPRARQKSPKSPHRGGKGGKKGPTKHTEIHRHTPPKTGGVSLCISVYFWAPILPPRPPKGTSRAPDARATKDTHRK